MNNEEFLGIDDRIFNDPIYIKKEIKDGKIRIKKDDE